MGHSSVKGNGSEIEVRDSTFEIVLDRLLVEIELLPADDTRDDLQKTVSAWTEYWVLMPPGCKDVDVRGLPQHIRQVLKAMLHRIHEAAPAGSETARVAKQFGDLLDQGEVS